MPRIGLARHSFHENFWVGLETAVRFYRRTLTEPAIIVVFVASSSCRITEKDHARKKTARVEN